MFWLAAAGVASAAAKLYAGKQASTEAKYNAKVKEEQAQFVEQQKGLALYQADRLIGLSLGKFTQQVAKSGILMTGSPIAAMLDMTTQMEMDKLIEQYNLEVQKRGVLSEASAYKRQATTAMNLGYANAFSTLLTTAGEYKINKLKYPSKPIPPAPAPSPKLGSK